MSHAPLGGTPRRSLAVATGCHRNRARKHVPRIDGAQRNATVRCAASHPRPRPEFIKKSARRRHLEPRTKER
eukprot:2833308-Prymnesium_polylepis.4